MYVDLLKQPLGEHKVSCLLQVLGVKDDTALQHPILKSNKAIEYGLSNWHLSIRLQ